MSVGLLNKKGFMSKTIIFYKHTSQPRQENPFGSISGSIIFDYYLLRIFASNKFDILALVNAIVA